MSVAAGGIHSRPGGVLVPAVFALVALIGFIGLGTWQLERKAWKEALIGTLEARLEADPIPVPAPQMWSSLVADSDEFRRVSLRVVFERDAQALVYTIGSTLRADVSGPGYWVLAPARLENGGTVVVNRGFVPEGEQKNAAHPLQGPVAIVGVMRWPEQRSWFTPKDDPAANLWFARDHLAIARAKGWGEVAPFLVELETPPGEGHFPRAGPMTVKLRNEHLQYALTWFGLAAVVAICFAFWLRSRRDPSVN